MTRTFPESLLRRQHRDREYGLRRALITGDLLSITLAIVLAQVGGGSSGPASQMLWYLFTLPAWTLLFAAYHLYRRPIEEIAPNHLDDAQQIFHALITGTLGMWVFSKFGPLDQMTLAEIVIFWLTAMALTVGFRWIAGRINLRIHGPSRVLLVADEADAIAMRRRLENHREFEMELTTVIDQNSAVEASVGVSIDVLEARLDLERIDHVIIRLDLDWTAPDLADELMYTCFRRGIRFSAYPGPQSLLLPNVRLTHIEGMGILTHNPPTLSRGDRILKRCLDVSLSSILLVLLLPVLLLVAIAIKLDSRGSALFRQTRIGKHGETFKVNKFRTMVPDADSMTEELMKRSSDPDWLDIGDDPRITRVGSFLRRTSLDELPQLWNVLIGEMSLVGPRPLSERDALMLIGRQRHRADLAPGITGRWQVLGRTSIPFREMVEIDYGYVTSWSLWLDVRTILATIPIVFSRRGVN